MQQPTPPPPPPQMSMIPPFPANSITTEQIQKFLDENKTLILAILENQNLGKLAECAEYQARLQNNLMYLAAIADAQPQAATVPSQMVPHPAMQQGGHYMQHPLAGLPQQQPIGFPPKSPLQFNYQQMQEQQRLQMHHQQALQGQMGVRTGAFSGMQGIYTEGSNSGGLPSTGGFPGGGTVPGPSISGDDPGASTSSPDAPEGKQDGAEAGSVDGQGNSAAPNNNNEGEQAQMKGSENTK